MAEENGEGVYHERQRLQLCLLHTLNNLLQREEFTRKELDGIADNLPTMTAGDTKWNPFKMIFKSHHNSLTGYYDANVLYAALDSRGKEIKWHDNRDGTDDINPTATYGDRFVGIIVNFPAKRYGGLVKTRHWVALRIVQGQWYNLDSDFVEPMVLSNGLDDLKRYLASVLFNSGQVLMVVENPGK